MLRRVWDDQEPGGRSAQCGQGAGTGADLRRWGALHCEWGAARVEERVHHVAARLVLFGRCDVYAIKSHVHADVPDQPAIVRQYMRYTGQIHSGKNAAKVIMRALQMSVAF